MTAPHESTVKVFMAPELMEQWASRDIEGRRLTWDWGEPDAYGFHTPTVTTHDDDRLGELDRASPSSDPINSSTSISPPVWTPATIERLFHVLDRIAADLETLRLRR